MRDLEKALTDIRAVRSQIARETEFRGYGWMAFAATGIFAVIAALLQPVIVQDPGENSSAYLALWIVTAGVACVVIALDVFTRSRRVHSGLANEMVQTAAEHLLPSLVAGALLTFVIARFVPEALWMLPGLWQVILSLGIFASCRLLPAPFMAVGVWYLASGLFCLALTNGDNSFSPWMMGLPFGAGQLLAAALVWKFGAGHAED